MRACSPGGPTCIQHAEGEGLFYAGALLGVGLGARQERGGFGALVALRRRRARGLAPRRLRGRDGREERGDARRALGDATDDALRGVFDKFDTNGDGGLDASELKVALRGAVGLELSLDDCRQLVAFADRDGTGRLEFDEFRAMIDGMIDDYGPEAVANRKKARSPLFSPNKL